MLLEGIDWREVERTGVRRRQCEVAHFLVHGGTLAGILRSMAAAPAPADRTITRIGELLPRNLTNLCGDPTVTHS
jgi:hypothetical protein